jgi:hypothetical protein
MWRRLCLGLAAPQRTGARRAEEVAMGGGKAGGKEPRGQVAGIARGREEQETESNKNFGSGDCGVLSEEGIRGTLYCSRDIMENLHNLFI